MHCPAAVRLFVTVALATAAFFHREVRADYRVPSPALASMVDAPLPPVPVLSPDRRFLLLLDRPEAPSISELAQPELRLAGLRINPAANGPSRSLFFTRLTLKAFADRSERVVSGLPSNVRIGDYEWSRDSRHLALTVVCENGIELWLVNVGTAVARRLTAPILNAVLGEPIGWLDDSTLIVRRVPDSRSIRGFH